MKQKTLLLLTALFFTAFIYAQDNPVAPTTPTAETKEEFKGNVSAAFGPLNGKVRIQYEMALKSRASYGVNMNYYLVNWTGPVFEPFIRVYGKKNGNAEGFFFQTKAIYGNLSTLDWELNSTKIENSRFSTFGFGMNIGNKFLLGKHITLEGLFGYRFLTPPLTIYKTGFIAADLIGTGVETIGWYVTTGFPLDLQFKLGYQF
jgi:hypothetical protein